MPYNAKKHKNVAELTKVINSLRKPRATLQLVATMVKEKR